MKNYGQLVLLIITLGIIGYGCDKKPDGSFILKGRLLTVSDSTVVAGHSVTVIYELYKGGLSGEVEFLEVGSSTSTDNGSFEILCDYYPDWGSGYYFKETDLPINVDIYPQKKGDRYC